jgi:secondary thiamine-phosphate synthase enzyme
MKLVQHRLTVATGGQSLRDITAPIAEWVAAQSIADGLLNVFLQHTSASLVIQENADPDVLRDLETFFRKLAPEGDHYRHSAEGPDDMPAHIRSAVLPTQLQVPVTGGRLALGTWQAIYLYEHRRAGHRRSVVLTLTGT